MVMNNCNHWNKSCVLQLYLIVAIFLELWRIFTHWLKITKSGVRMKIILFYFIFSRSKLLLSIGRELSFAFYWPAMWYTEIMSMCRTHGECSHTDGKQWFQNGKVEQMDMLVFTRLVFTFRVSTYLIYQKCKPLS